LSEGWLEGDQVECPLHGGRFEVATGKAMGDPVDCDLKTYPVRVSGEDVEVCI
jgi:nitrite reductase/ring-hydroxylating ferredoxin subunit